jgi:hypothetical protein
MGRACPTMILTFSREMEDFLENISMLLRLFIGSQIVFVLLNSITTRIIGTRTVRLAIRNPRDSKKYISALEWENSCLPKEYAWVGKSHTLHDWTDGCIAVTDEEMDELWKLVRVGTPIDIKP